MWTVLPVTYLNVFQVVEMCLSSACYASYNDGSQGLTRGVCSPSNPYVSHSSNTNVIFDADVIKVVCIKMLFV